jgi:hypothetical protein
VVIKPRWSGTSANLEGDVAVYVPCQFKCQLVENHGECNDAREQPRLAEEDHLKLVMGGSHQQGNAVSFFAVG